MSRGWELVLVNIRHRFDIGVLSVGTNLSSLTSAKTEAVARERDRIRLARRLDAVSRVKLLSTLEFIMNVPKHPKIGHIEIPSKDLSEEGFAIGFRHLHEKSS